MININDSQSRENANHALVSKPGQVKSRFTFKYLFIYEDISTRYMEMLTTKYDLLSILLH